MRQTLIEIRRAKGLTQQELGEMIGLSKSSVSDLERGRVQGKISVWRSIAKTLNVPLEILLDQ